ncbi:MAG: hypothetical protein WKG01_08740 [Kofleriaceae bacterium]
MREVVTVPVDAAIAIGPAPVAAPPAPPVRPHRTRDPIVKREPPKPDVSRVDPPAADSKSATRCDKRDPDYWLCINGEDR